MKCDVCGKPPLGIASSSFGAISFAYCEECARKPAEPFAMFEFLYDEVSTDGKDLREDTEVYSTFHNGKYMTWNEYVQWRRDNGRGKSEPCEIPLPDDAEGWVEEGF